MLKYNVIAFFLLTANKSNEKIKTNNRYVLLCSQSHMLCDFQGNRGYFLLFKKF